MVSLQPLLLDCGNTSIKYQLGSESGRLSSVSSVMELVRSKAIGQVVLASVSSQGNDIKHLLTATGVSCIVLKVCQHWQGLNLCYQHPERLGIDRWLSLVALAGGGQDVLVVDVGTALTIDVMDHTDQHKGGYILPGLGLMRRSLVDDTFALPAVSEAASVGLGQSTTECIANGTLLALAATVDSTIDRLQWPQVSVYWTGGDADIIRAFSRHSGQSRMSLVFDGMKRLLADRSYMETLL